MWFSADASSARTTSGGTCGGGKGEAYCCVLEGVGGEPFGAVRIHGSGRCSWYGQNVVSRRRGSLAVVEERKSCCDCVKRDMAGWRAS
eukprot:1028097-Pleurochrysis_carterae.AAC.1